MTSRIRTGLFVLVLAQGLAGCGSSPGSPSPLASLPIAVKPPSLVVFTDPSSGFSTSDLRDAQDHIVQFNTANELIWPADETRLSGYKVEQQFWGVHGDPDQYEYQIGGKICAEGCVFVVRFGTRD